MSQHTATNSPTPKKRRNRLIRTLVILAILLVVLVVTAPWIVAQTGLRDSTINAILASPTVTASTDSASFGWASPLSIRGLDLQSTNKRFDVHVDDITAEQPPLKLLSTSPDLGTIRVNKPHVRLELPLDVKLKDRGERLVEPTFTAIITDGALTVRLVGVDDPVLDVDAINMTVRVEESEGGRVLTLDPVVIFDRRKLTGKLAKSLLHLFDPTIGDTGQLSGEISLSLDKLRIPVGVPREEAVKRMQVEGKLVLHNVSTEPTNPMRKALVQLVADMNGKEASDVVRLAQEAEIRFQVREGRLHHEGLRIGFPDIDDKLVVSSRGSVGLDKSLDLHLELPRLDKALREGKGPAKCRITGTIDEPKITVEDGTLVLRQHDHKVPIIAVDGINLTMRVEKTASGPVFTVDPVKVFKNEKLSLVKGNGLVSSLVKANGLASLVVPDVVDGEISLEFSTIRIPVGVPKDQLVKGLEAEGKLTLHNVTTEVKKPMWQALLKLLADMNGKETSDLVRLAKDAEIHFKVSEGRLHHEGLRIGFPDIDKDLVVSSRGSVGLDKSLDLVVELPRLDKTLRKDKKPAICRITGTIDNPKITVEDGTLVLRQHDRKEPIIAVDGINLSMHVEKTDSGPVFIIDPVKVFNKEKLNVVTANGLVALIVPDVQAERQVTGEISLEFSTIRVPLTVDRDQLIKELKAEGKFTLHNVTTEVKKPMWQALVKLLADMNGKQPSNVVRLVDDAEIRFQVRDGRLHHDGLRIGFPGIDSDLVVSSRGSIGTDETLDLHVEFPRLRKEKRDKGLVKCHVTGTLSEPKVSVPDASLVVQLTDAEKATLTVDNVNLNFSVEPAKEGRMLTLAPVTLLDKRKLTPEVADEMLKLIAPTLADLSGVQGEISLRFETFRVPLGVPKSEALKRVELEGKLHLHQITVSAKTPLIQALVKVLADMYGKKPSDVVRIVKEAEVRFQVRDGRMHHEGLPLGFPDISPELLVNSRGSVGFDTSLDLVLEIPRLLLDKKDPPGTRGPPVRFRVTGTIDKPIVTEIKGEKDK